jgi:hypothetical protein
MTRAKARPGRTSHDDGPDIAWLVRVAVAKEQLMRELWVRAVQAGRSEYWVAREFERLLGVRPISAGSGYGARATGQAGAHRTRPGHDVARGSPQPELVGSSCSRRYRGA